MHLKNTFVYLSYAYHIKHFYMKTKIWINEFEDTNTDPEVIFEGDVTGYPEQKGDAETQPLPAGADCDCWWDTTKYTAEQNSVIELYREQAESELIKAYEDEYANSWEDYI